jgi:hypothetical protein
LSNSSGHSSSRPNDAPDEMIASESDVVEASRLLKERETKIAAIIDDWDQMVSKSGYFPLFWEKVGRTANNSLVKAVLNRGAYSIAT